MGGFPDLGEGKGLEPWQKGKSGKEIGRSGKILLRKLWEVLGVILVVAQFGGPAAVGAALEIIL